MIPCSGYRSKAQRGAAGSLARGHTLAKLCVDQLGIEPRVFRLYKKIMWLYVSVLTSCQNIGRTRGPRFLGRPRPREERPKEMNSPSQKAHLKGKQPPQNKHKTIKQADHATRAETLLVACFRPHGRGRKDANRIFVGHADGIISLLG